MAVNLDSFIMGVLRLRARADDVPRRKRVRSCSRLAQLLAKQRPDCLMTFEGLLRTRGEVSSFAAQRKRIRAVEPRRRHRKAFAFKKGTLGSERADVFYPLLGLGFTYPRTDPP